MLRKLYDQVIRLAATRWAVPALAAVAFAESSFFPIIPDVLLAPMVLARRERAWLFATVCTVASVLGGLFGYLIGYWLQPVGEAMLRFFGDRSGLPAYKALFAQWGFWIILVKGFTPVPFKLITIASGLAQFNLGQFVFACSLTRGARFFLETALLRHPRAKAIIDRHLVALTLAGIVAVAAAFIAVRLLAHG